MSEHHYKFNITMTCGGCSGAVDRVLKKLDGRSFLPPPCRQAPTRLSFLRIPCVFSKLTSFIGLGVKEYNVSLDTQTADVTAVDSLSYEAVLEKIKKTGKTVNSGEKDGVIMSV